MTAILFIVQSLTVIAGSLFIIYLLNFKIKKSSFFALHLIVTLLLALGSYLIPSLSAAIPGLPFDIPYKLPLDILLSFLLVFLFSSDRFGRKLSVLCWEKIVYLASEVLCSLLYSGITGISPAGVSAISDPKITLRVILNILYDIIYFVSLYFVYAILSRGKQRRNMRQFAPAALIISTQILLFFTAVFQQGEAISTSFTITAFAVMIICILSDIYLIIIAPPKAAENHALQERVRCMEEIQSGERDFFSSLLEKEHEMSALRHDWNNLLQVASTQMNKDRKNNSNNQATITLLQALMDRVNEIGLTRYCQNEMLNVLLNAKAKTLKEKSLPFEISCTLPEQPPMDPLDLCSLISHLIDQAVKACNAEPSKENEIKISVKILSTDSIAIRISCHMPLLPQQKLYNPNRPSNKEIGYGMEIVHSIIQKYNGDLDITRANGAITTSVLVTNRS